MPGEVIASPIPLLGFCAWGSGVGKTTLLTSVIPYLTRQGVKVSVIKHSHHAFDIDRPGKDSYRLREAGAVQTMLGSPQRWALMTEFAHLGPTRQEPDLAELLRHMDTSLADLILVEGFRQEPIPKIEIHRPSLGHSLMAASDPRVIAIATDAPATTHLPLLDLNDPAAVADFVLAWLEQQQATSNPATTNPSPKT